LKHCAQRYLLFIFALAGLACLAALAVIICVTELYKYSSMAAVIALLPPRGWG